MKVRKFLGTESVHHKGRICLGLCASYGAGGPEISIDISASCPLGVNREDGYPKPQNYGINGLA